MPKKTVTWSPEARADLRAIDREIALRILRAIDLSQYRCGRREKAPTATPRVGDYRVLFLPRGELAVEVPRVLHRKDAYR